MFKLKVFTDGDQKAIRDQPVLAGFFILAAKKSFSLINQLALLPITTPNIKH